MPVVDRSHLPIRRPTFGGVVKRTLAGSQPDWNLIGHPTPPDGAPNVLLVLIDDAGFGNPSTFGGPIQTPNYTRMADGGVRYNRFHVTAICSPTRAALLTGRNSHSVGFGSVGEFAGGYPGYSATLPRDCAPLPRILRDNGYNTAAFGKWHLTPDGQQGPGGPFDRWPTGWGFEYFYGFLGGGAGQWDTVLAENQKIIGVDPRYGDEDGPVLPARRDGRQDHRMAPRHPGTGRQEAVLRLLLHRLQPRSAPRRRVVGGQVQGQIRPGLGPSARGDVRPPAGARCRAARGGTHAAQRGLSRLGERAGQAQGVLFPTDGGLCRLLRERRPQRRSGHRCHRRAGRARQHPRHLDLGRQRSQHGGHRHRLVQRADDAERHPPDRRDAAPAIRALRRHGSLGRRDHGAALRCGLGLGRQHAVPVGQAGRLAPRRHAQPDGHPLARQRPRGRRSPVAIHPRDRHRTDHPRHRRHPSADDGRRHRPAAPPRGRLHRQPDDGRCAGAAHAAVFRVGRQPGHVQGRLVAVDAHGPHPVGADAAGDHALRAGRLGPGRRSDRALLPARRLQPGARPGRRAARQGGRAQGTLLAGSRTLPGAPAASPRSHRSSASCPRCPRPPSSSSGAMSRTCFRA